jgi:hypothetical protein
MPKGIQIITQKRAGASIKQFTLGTVNIGNLQSNATDSSTVDLTKPITDDDATDLTETSSTSVDPVTSVVEKDESMPVDSNSAPTKEEPLRKESTLSGGRRTLSSVLEALHQQQQQQQQKDEKSSDVHHLTIMRPPPPIVKNLTKEQLIMCGRCASDLPVLRRLVVDGFSW